MLHSVESAPITFDSFQGFRIHCSFGQWNQDTCVSIEKLSREIWILGEHFRGVPTSFAEEPKGYTAAPSAFEAFAGHLSKPDSSPIKGIVQSLIGEQNVQRNRMTGKA